MWSYYLSEWELTEKDHNLFLHRIPYIYCINFMFQPYPFQLILLQITFQRWRWFFWQHTTSWYLYLLETQNTLSKWIGTLFFFFNDFLLPTAFDLYKCIREAANRISLLMAMLLRGGCKGRAIQNFFWKI